MKRLALAFALIPATAFAHGGPEGHLHPHGLESAMLALAGFAVALIVWRRAK